MSAVNDTPHFNFILQGHLAALTATLSQMKADRVSEDALWEVIELFSDLAADMIQTPEARRWWDMQVLQAMREHGLIDIVELSSDGGH